jgi:hypothetical protein
MSVDHIDSPRDLNVPDDLPLPTSLSEGVDMARVEAAVRAILAAIGEDPGRDGLHPPGSPASTPRPVPGSTRIPSPT